MGTQEKVWTGLKNEVLGEAYELSWAFISSAEALALNRRYRGKDKPANVLSFPLAADAGEILINRAAARRDHFPLVYLFIHGLLHLKGLNHGSTMSREEQRLLRSFASYVKTNRRRT